MPSRRRNAASRLLLVVDSLPKKENGKNVQDTLRDILCRSAPKDMFFSLLGEVENQIIEVGAFARDNSLEERWQRLDFVRQVLGLENLGAQYSPKGDHHAAHFILDHLAGEMDDEGTVPQSELDKLAETVRQLQKDVRLSSIKPSLRNWIIELLQMVLDGIARYEISGVRGLKKELVAILMKAAERANEAKEETPDKWAQVLEAIKEYGVVVAAGSATVTLGVHVVKLLTYLSGNGDIGQ